MSTTYAVTENPTIVDNAASTLVAIQNTGTSAIRTGPLGRTVAAGTTVTVPGWLTVPTTLQTAGGVTSTAAVTLTAGTPATAPGPGPLTIDPNGVASLSVTITGGSWFTDEGLKTAASFPVTITTVTPLYPAAPATVTVTATAGGVTKTAGHTVTKGDSGSFKFTLDPADLPGFIAATGGGGGAVSSVVAQTGAVTGTQILADTAVSAALAGKDASGAAAAAQAAAIAASAQRASNLSDLASASSARTSLGLGTAAVMTPASIAADSAFAGAYADANLPAAAVAAGCRKRFDPTRSVYNATSRNLRRSRQKLSQAIVGTELFRVACLGDSTTFGAGDGVTDISTGTYPAYLASLLSSGTGAARATGLSGPSQAYVPDLRWSAFTGTWDDANMYRQSGSSGAQATFTSDRAGTFLDIWYYQGVGAFTYNIDGAGPVTVTPTGGGNMWHKTTVSGLANTVHTVVFTQSTASAVALGGMEVYGASGVSVTNFGAPGAGSATFVSGGGTGHPQTAISTYMVPDLVLINLGINDYFTQGGTAPFEANLHTLIALYPNSDVVLGVGTPVSVTTDVPPWIDYVTSVYRVAENLDIPVVDLTDRWVSYALSAAMISTDGTHPLKAGYADIARAWFGLSLVLA